MGSHGQTLASSLVLRLELGHQFGRALHRLDGTNALAAAPDVFPGFFGVTAKVHLAGVGLGQVLRVQARRTDGRGQVISVHTREQVAVDDVVGVAVDDGLFVVIGGTGFVRGDEGRADVGEVRTHGLRGQDGATGSDRPREDDRTVIEAPDFADQLRAACPDGIDVHFENVGGVVLDTMLAQMNRFSRIVICGLIAEYEATAPYAYTRLRSVLVNRIRMQGMIVFDWKDRYGEALQGLAKHLAAGRLKYRESIVVGIDNAPRGLMGLLRGENFGKQLVRLA